jgi:hypothetical protein
MRITIAVLLALATPAHADGDAVSPSTARWISIATTTAGLGLSGYMWHRADGLEEGHGRAELQLASIGTGLFTIGVGPASGLIVAGEYRRSVGGAIARPLLVGSGAVAIGLGAFIVMWGCFETNDCTGAKIGGGIVGGVGAAAAIGGLAWGAYDIWDTPRILRKRMAKRTVLAPLIGADRIGVALTIVD